MQKISVYEKIIRFATVKIRNLSRKLIITSIVHTYFFSLSILRFLIVLEKRFNKTDSKLNDIYRSLI